jgi:protein TonB
MSENNEKKKKKAVVPLTTEYGAKELKIWINKYTIRSFFYTLAGLILFVLINLANTTLSNAGEQEVRVAPIVKLTIEDLPPPPVEDLEAAPPPPSQTIINSGPAARAGTPVPVPDAQITPDMQDFATLDIMSRASAEGGDGLDLGGFSDNIDFDGTKVKVEVREEEPDPDEFIPVEKEPGVDLVKLQKLITYPDLARRAGIEGSVVLRVLVEKDGNVKRTLIEYSENELLNQAAIDAVTKYGKFTPAIQNNQPITCWVSIPIRFKLR